MSAAFDSPSGGQSKAGTKRHYSEISADGDGRENGDKKQTEGPSAFIKRMRPAQVEMSDAARNMMVGSMFFQPFLVRT